MVNVKPVVPQTLGQHLDAVLTAAGHDVSIAAADAKGWVASAWAWVQSNWVHVAGYASIVAAIKKLI